MVKDLRIKVGKGVVIDVVGGEGRRHRYGGKRVLVSGALMGGSMGRKGWVRGEEEVVREVGRVLEEMDEKGIGREGLERIMGAVFGRAWEEVRERR